MTECGIPGAPGSIAINQTLFSLAPRDGAARPVKRTPGTSKVGASADEMRADLEANGPGDLHRSFGYVERISDPSDGRVRRVRLTPRGHEALGRARAFHTRFEAELAARIGAEQAATVRAVLTDLAAVDASGATASRNPADVMLAV